MVLLDVNLPDANGLDLLPQIKKHWPDTEVIVLTGEATFEAAVEATKRGAFHFINKPFDTQALLVTLERALENKQQNEESNSLRRALSTMSGGASPIFRSPAMQQVVRTVERIAPSDVTILITGESGTGKEVIADLIHALSPRSKNKIIKINCAALPRELIESELFGSVKGAFTGAQCRPRRAVPPGRGRHAVPRRNFRDARSTRKASCCACCRTRKSGPSAANRQLQDQLPHRRRHQPQARGRHQGRQAARRFVLPHQRDFRLSAAVARTPRRHPAAGQFIPETIRRAGQPRHPRFQAGRDRTAHQLRLAGQHPPVAERNSARRALERRQ